MTFRADFNAAGHFRKRPYVHFRAIRSAKDMWGAASASPVVGRGRVPVTPRPKMFNGGSRLPQTLWQATGLVRIVCLSFAVFAPAWVGLSSGVTELPAAEEVFQRHVAAVGGAAALSKPHNLVFKGEADLVPLKAKAPIEFYVQAPDRF